MRKFYFALMALVAWSGSVKSGAADSSMPEDRILFVHLKISTNGAALMQVVTRPGRLKAPKERGTIEVELQDGQGNTVATARAEDPLQQRFEYAGPDGTVRSQTFSQQEGEIVARVPYHGGAKTCKVWRRKSGQGGGLQAAAVTKELLGQFAIPAETQK